MVKDPSLIPKGMYCYDYLIESGKSDNGMPRFKYHYKCPYHCIIPQHEYQNNGYCAYQEYGDWEAYPFGLLWDLCKCCGVNEEDDDNVLCDTGL